jgi:hypothetical protein
VRTALLFFALILPSLAFASDPLTQSEKDHFRALGAQLLQRAQDYYGQNDPLKGADIAALPMEARTDVVYHNEEVRLGSFRSPVIFDFDRSSARLRSFFNVAVSNQPNPELDQPPKMIWSKEQVQAKAERFVVAVLGKMPEEAGKEAVVDFTPKVLFAADKSRKYQFGTWRVVWYRQNKQGVKFLHDTLIVQMIDGEEPLGFGYNFWSSYQDNNVEPISPEKAVALAKAVAPKIMVWPPGAMWLKDHTLVDTPKWELWIVNPNHLLSQSEIGGIGDATARLAWVVTYPKAYSGPKKPGGGVPAGGDLEVWIDAETGEFLGGDFQ